jgi:hypothetical protein
MMGMKTDTTKSTPSEEQPAKDDTAEKLSDKAEEKNEE